MSDQRTRRILTINIGSSSLKAALYDLGNEERLGVQAVVKRIGLSESNLRISDASGACPQFVRSVARRRGEHRDPGSLQTGQRTS